MALNNLSLYSRFASSIRSTACTPDFILPHKPPNINDFQGITIEKAAAEAAANLSIAVLSVPILRHTIEPVHRANEVLFAVFTVR